jgi:hypothetical protein
MKEGKREIKIKTFSHPAAAAIERERRESFCLSIPLTFSFMMSLEVVATHTHTHLSLPDERENNLYQYPPRAMITEAVETYTAFIYHTASTHHFPHREELL